MSLSLERGQVMEEDAAPVTGEQYIEMLIDASCWDASEMESGFMSWCEKHVPIWREQGYDETWIRQRIEAAQSTRGLNRTLKEQGWTMLEIREELRKVYAAHPVNPMTWRENGNVSTMDTFAIVAIQAISANAIRCAS